VKKGISTMGFVKIASRKLRERNVIMSPKDSIEKIITEKGGNE